MLSTPPPLPTSRRTAITSEALAMWQLAWPVLVGQLATVGMSAADVAMTGHASADDLAAVALASSVWSTVLVTIIGVMMAVNAVVAHEVGADSTKNIAHIVRQALWQALGIGLLACVVVNISAMVFDHLGMTPLVRDKATQFIHIISIGLPPFAAYRVLYGYSASLNQTKPAMVIALLALLLNIGMNWLLIYGHWGLPKLGALGCAWSTGSIMWMMLAAMIWWIRRGPAYRSTMPLNRWEKPCWPEIARMLKIGIPIGVTYCAEISAFAIVGLLVARFGVVSIAAHQIALNFISLVFMVPLSVGIGLITRVGMAVGEGALRRARFVSWVGVGVSLAFGVVSATLIILFRHAIAAGYATDPAVQDVTARLLLLAALFQLSDSTQVAAASAIRGYKVTRPPMLIHLLAFWGCAVPLGCVLGLGYLPDWVAHWLPGFDGRPMATLGFWIGLVVGLTVAAILLVWYLHRLSQNRIDDARHLQAFA